jgi:1,4-alpha-glucan branching enzyme
MGCGKKACATTEKKGKAKKKAVRKTIPSTEFSYTSEDAESVFLVGEFNDWNEEKFNMRRYKNGIFKKKIKLKPGSYQYRFIVDGEWIADPGNSESVANPYGSENSVKTVS